MSRSMYLVSMLVGALLVLPPASYAAQAAFGSISVNCADGAAYDGGPVSSSDSVSCSYPVGTNLYTSATATAGFTQSPSLSASASAGGTASRMSLRANGGGVLTYFVSIVPQVAPPVTPASIPVRFSARGGISISGGTYASGSSGGAEVVVHHSSGSPLAFPADDFSVNVQYPPSGVATAGFDRSVTLDLIPSSDPYLVDLAAGCQVLAVVPYDAADPGRQVTVHGGCSAFVDPSFTFDQGAFDAQMGGETFALSDYYKIELSPNLVPEPESVLLMGLGIAMLVGLSRRSRVKRHRSPR